MENTIEKPVETADNTIAFPTPVIEETKPIDVEAENRELEALRRRGDVDGLKKKIEQYQKPKTTEAVGDKTTPTETGEVSRETKPEKKWHQNFDGSVVEMADNDNFLGYGDFGKLKKSAAWLKLQNDKVQKELFEARKNQAIAPAGSTKEKEYEAEIVRLKNELADNKVTKQVEAQATHIERKPYPKMPDVAFDPMDDDVVAKFQAYWKEQSDWITEYGVASQAQPQQVVSTDLRPDDRAAIDKIKEFAVEQERQRNIEQNKKNSELKAKKYSDFQNKYDPYKTDKPIFELETEVLNWSDGLAQANEIVRPTVAWSRGSPEWINYEQQRLALVDRVINEDETVVPNGAPPKDYDKYYLVLGLDRYWQNKIASGELGQSSTLEQAFNLRLHETGQDAEILEKHGKDVGTQLNKALIDTLKSNEQNFAHAAPVDVTNRSTNKSTYGIPDVTDADVQKYLTLNDRQVNALSPEEKTKRGSVIASLKAKAEQTENKT